MKDETLKQVAHCENMMNTYTALAILLAETLKRDHTGVTVRANLPAAIGDLEIMAAYFYEEGQRLQG